MKLEMKVYHDVTDVQDNGLASYFDINYRLFMFSLSIF